MDRDKKVISLDQTGLSQKGGSVVSHLKIIKNDKEYSSRVANGESDAYLVFDLLSQHTRLPSWVSRIRIH